MKKFVKGLIVTAVILVLINAAFLGYLWFQNTHFFVDGKPYPNNAQFLDLREKEITPEHYRAIQQQLPNCEILWMVPFQDGKLDSDSQSIRVQFLSDADVTVLNTFFPKLTTVQAEGCTEYSVLSQLHVQRPDLTLEYTVNLGGREVAPNAVELVLESGEFEWETMQSNLRYLPDLKTLQLKKTTLTGEQLAALEEAYPEVSVVPTVEILGKEYGLETTELDLSELTESQISAVGEKLAMLPNLSNVELMKADGSCNLSAESVRQLIQKSNAAFHFTFEFFGETLSSDMEEVVLKYKKIGDAGEEQVRLALELMSGCRRFVLDSCGLSDEVMAQIREDFRGRTKVVWRVRFGDGSSLTDAEVIRSVYDLVDDNSAGLNYCEDVVYMDIGHDVYLDYITFIEHMPKLEVCIVSGSPIKDLSPFAACKNLRILELSDCGYIDDLSPLAQCERLEMINFSYTKVKDLSPLDNLNLTHLVAKWHYSLLVSEEEQERFMELHPDCWAQFDKDDMPYGIGWRYIEKNKKMEWYETVATMFRYPKPPNNTGWYMD